MNKHDWIVEEWPLRAGHGMHTVKISASDAKYAKVAINYHDRLVEALRGCSTELTEAIEGKYHGILGYPSTDRDYRTDMAIVESARALLAEIGEGE